MKLKKYNDFIKESLSDKYDLFDILREYGVFNPPEFMKYLNELGYTIIELDPVENGIQESFNLFNTITEDDEWFDEVYDDEEDRLHNWLVNKGVKNPDTFFNELYDSFGIAIVKDSDWEPVEEFVSEEFKTNNEFDVREKIRKKLNPSIEEKISKLTNIMMDASYNGLRVNLSPDNLTDKQIYDHIMKYVNLNKKLLKGIIRLEDKVDKLKNEHKLSSEELKEFNDFVVRALQEIHYRYPWKFKGQLSTRDKDEMNDMINIYNKLADKYHSKKITPKK